MSDANHLATIAALIADPTRAEMLVTLMDGRAYPAAELAARAHVSPSTGSHHLAKLVKGGLVEVCPQRRQRYFRISDYRMAEVVEALGAFRRPEPAWVARPRSACGLEECRSCYDHLAGRLGVELRLAFECRGMIVLRNDRFEVTEAGERTFGNFGINVSALRAAKRPLARACLDWTERIPHIGGALGKALLDQFIERGWLIRGEIPRQLILTPIGMESLESLFGLKIA